MTTAKAIKRSLDIHHHVELVDKIVAATDAINLAETAIAEAREVLDPEVTALRREASYGGVLVSQLHVRGSNRSLSYEFKNQYTTTSTVAEAKMKEKLGPLYDQLFTRKTTVKVKDGALEQIEALLGDRFKDLFETVETITPKPEFRQAVHQLRQQLPVDTVKQLDEYEVAFCCKPAMKVGS